MYWATHQYVLGNTSLCTGQHIIMYWATHHHVLGNTYWAKRHYVLGITSLCTGQYIMMYWATHHYVLSNTSLCTGNSREYQISLTERLNKEHYIELCTGLSMTGYYDIMCWVSTYNRTLYYSISGVTQRRTHIASCQGLLWHNTITPWTR